MVRFFLLTAFLFQLSTALPSGFIDEGIADIKAVTGAFAPNPRNNGKPMLILSAKEGKVRVLEDPDNSDDFREIADMESKMCTNGERGLQTVRPHPDFANNRYIYMFYSVKTSGCKESAKDGPPNRLSRFKVNANSLNVDLSTEEILLETSPAAKRMHNGGTIQFGNDGKLWVTLGDGGSRKPPVSQDDGILFGSILRLNDDGTAANDNPFVENGVRCGDIGGIAPSGKRCSEIYATGTRNPFRLVMDPNTKNKVKFHFGDVGASAWEEISVGGTDYAGVNYGWPAMEGPCKRGDNRDCPVNKDFLDPFYYYEHTGSSAGGAVTGSAFVPDDLGWPSKFKYLFIDFVFHEIYNLREDDDRECRSCKPPVPAYRNETFHEFPYMVDMFFGPYKSGQALYYVARSDGQNVRRIRYTANSNRAPEADIDVDVTTVTVGDSVVFDGRDSSDADGDDLNFFWDFGDGSSSTGRHPEHIYDEKGEYKVTLTITDERGQTDQAFVNMVVGSPPSAEMISPKEGDEFFVGQVLRLVGSGADSDGNELTSSELFWEVKQHHNDHFHPFFDRTSGNDFILFPAPEPEDFNAATTSYLEIIMYAVDKDGLTTTVSRNIMPKLVLVDVDSDPQGLQVLIDEFPVRTPKTITTWENHELRLDVEDQWPYTFSFWSDAGDRQHSITIPAASSSNVFVSTTFEETTTVARAVPLIGDVRECSSGDRCQQCEGHCTNDNDCQGMLICFKKGGRGNPVPGCIGTDNSGTDWCTAPEFLEGPTNPPPTSPPPTNPLPTNPPPTNPPPTSPPPTNPPPTNPPPTSPPPTNPPPTNPPPTNSPPSVVDLPRISKVRDCSSTDQCDRCEGHCTGHSECKGTLKCFRKVGEGKPVPGCIGIDDSFTDWCTLAELVPALPAHADIPLVTTVRGCTNENPCNKCEGHCQGDSECAGDLRCFMKGGEGRSVVGCIGIDNSNTDWCTDEDF